MESFEDNLSKRKIYWICQIAGWSFYLISGITITSIIIEGFELRIFFVHLYGAIIFLLITHFGRKILNKEKVFKKKLSTILVILSVFVITATFLGVSLVRGPLILFDPDRALPTLSALFMSIINSIVTFTVWISLYAGFKIFSDYRENQYQKWKLEAKLLESEFAALKAQLNPHFVFNALNNIRSLIIENPEKAREALTTLSTLLRISLRFDKDLVISLEKEICMVREYLELEKLHLEERLRVFWDLPAKKNNYFVPALGIQTLVENAIKHGISPAHKGGDILISIFENERKLYIKVANSGQLIVDKENNSAIGLKNLKKRLKLFDERSQFKIEQSPNRTVTAQIILHLT